MAPQVADILIKLGISGDQDLERLRNVFKGLTSTIDITDVAINKAKNAIETYVKTANNSEAVIDGQIKAFERLKSQADATGTTYQTLDNDIKALKQQLIGASTNLLSQRDALIKNANATKASSSEVSKYVAQLKRLQEQTRISSQAFNTIESDIASLTLKMQQLRKEEMADFGKNAVTATKNALSGLQTGVQQSISLFTRLGEQSKTAFGQVARTVEGITALSVGGAVAGGGAGALGVLSSMLQGGGSSLANIKTTLGNLPGIGGQAHQLISPDAIASLTDAASNISALQAKVIGLDQAMGAVTGAFASLGPTAGAAAIAASTGIAIIYDRLRNEADKTRIDLEQSFKGIDDEVQSLLRSLTKLRDQIQSLSMTKINELLGTARQRFAAAPAGTPLSRSMASQIAGLESVQQQEAAAQADVLEEYRQRVRGTSTAITELNQRLTYLKSSISQVDTSTTEGRAKFAQLSNESIQLSEQIRKLGDSYRYVGDMAVQAATAEQNAANARIRNNYLNRSAVVAQEQALADLGRRVREGVAGTPLMLPAAGQTSAPGTGLAISGGAVVGRRTGAIQQIFAPGSGVGGVRFPGEISEPIGPQMTEAQADKQRRAYISTGDALRQKAEATRAAEQAEQQLRAAVSSATAANNGSITSLQNLRGALTALRDTIPGTDKEFKQLTQRLEDVDRRSNRLAAGSRRLSGSQLAQGFGAAVTGGIFGGPEGLIGGLGGLAVRGVGGAFAGSAIGAQVGMFRQQLGDLTEYSSRIDKLQISLRGIVGSQDAYNTVLTSAAKLTRDLNIPQETVIQGMTRLSAAVLGAGGNVSDSTFAFGAIAKAIKATGGSAEEADGAILALTQVFSKGKVSAEELNQIAERLPGTFTLFAKATGRTGPELLKALQDGKVGLNDLMKFLASIDTRYGQTALRVAKSTQDAGARMTVAMDAVRYSVGEALQPIGAQIQDAFTKALQNATPVLIGFANALTTTFKILVDNGPLITTTLSALLGFGTVAGVIAGVTKLGAVISTVTAFIVEFGGAASVATLAAESLGIAFAAVPGIGWIAGGITALGLLATTLYNNNIAFKTWVNNVGTIISNDFKNSMQNMVNIVAASSKKVSDVWGWLKDTTKRAANAIGNAFGSPFGFIADAAQRAFGTVQRAIAQMWNGIPAPIRKALGQGAVQALGPVGYAQSVAIRAFQMPPQPSSARRGEGTNTPLPSTNLNFTNFPTLTPTGRQGTSGRGTAGTKPEQLEVGGVLRSLSLDARQELNRQLHNLETQIQEAYKNNNIALGDSLQLKREDIILDVKLKALRDEERRITSEIVKAKAKGLNTTQAELQLRETGIAYDELFRESEERRTKELQKQVQALADINELLRQSFGPQRLGIFGEVPQQFTFERDTAFMPSAGTKREEAKRVAEDLQKLTDPLAQLTSAAEAMGSAFSTSFTSIINGSTTTQQALATLFTNISNYFLDMAGKIIAKWIEMAILNTVLSLFPTGIGKLGVGSSAMNLPGLEGAGALAGGGQGLASSYDWSSFTKGLKLNRLGAAYAANGIVPFAMGGTFQRGITPYAMGGIVSRPTFFAYANGGVPGTGLMGEAGPEAVVPLRRLPSGKLGVGSTGGGAVTVNVSVDATGSQVQGDAGKSNQLGRAVAAAVQAELIKQKRPGGLLVS